MTHESITLKEMTEVHGGGLSYLNSFRPNDILSIVYHMHAVDIEKDDRGTFWVSYSDDLHRRYQTAGEALKEATKQLMSKAHPYLAGW